MVWKIDNADRFVEFVGNKTHQRFLLQLNAVQYIHEVEEEKTEIGLDCGTTVTLDVNYDEVMEKIFLGSVG